MRVDDTNSKTSHLQGPSASSFKTNLSPEILEYIENKKTWFLTIDIAEELDRFTEFRVSFRDFIIYIFYLFCLITITMPQRSKDNFFILESIERTLIYQKFVSSTGSIIAFEDIKTVSDIWNYMENIMINSIYNEVLYDAHSHFVRRKTVPESGLMAQNKLLGVPQIRLLNSRKDSCNIHAYFQRNTTGGKSSLKYTECYSQITNGAIDRTPMGPKGMYKFFDNNQTDNPPFKGLVGNYPGGGYIQNLANNYQISKQVLKRLRRDNFISRASRLFTMGFTVYNSNFHQLFSIYIYFELPIIGSVMPSYKIVVNDPPGLTAYKLYFFFISMVYHVTLMYFFLSEVRQVLHFEFRYFTFFWSYMNLISITVNWFIMIYLMLAINEKKGIFSNVNWYNYINLEMVCYYKEIAEDFFGIALFVAYIKVFRYLKLFKFMRQFSFTIKRCLSDIINYTLLFLVIFLCYAYMGYLYFGEYVTDLSKIDRCMIYLLLTLLRYFDYNEIKAIDPMFAAVYFGTYIFFIIFISLNMFLAIINDAYTEYKVESITRPDSIRMNTYFKMTLNQWWCSWCPWEPSGLRAIIDSRYDTRIDASRITYSLMKWGFAKREAVEFLEMYRDSGCYKLGQFLDMVLGELEETPQVRERLRLHRRFRPTADDLLEYQEKKERMDSLIENMTDKISDLMERMNHMGNVQLVKK